LCHVAKAAEVLEVGCGIGVGAASLARDHACRVVAVGRSERMLEWARRRVRERGVEDRVELRVASATDLPFADGRFDLTYAESVLAFVDDPALALREMVRVTRPGGYVGISESIWTTPVTAELDAFARDLHAGVRSPAEWHSRLLAAGLEDVEVRLRRVDTGGEVRNRIRWVGLPWALRAWGRTIRLVLTAPGARARIRTFYGPGMRAFAGIGYGLFVGRVPRLRDDRHL
ncbi:MAG TPA: methyltransferase domain-containing protein, partial [Candidatus Limnocylindrales bacterium]|nr:methyltransferase domain-containing protein [Candidatus Limnocylindrales bacterium]